MARAENHNSPTITETQETRTIDGETVEWTIRNYSFDPDFLVYTDRDQCDMFNVDYFDDAELVVSPDALLRTKDYDQEHRDFLEPLIGTTLHLVRTNEEGPGWWRVISAIRIK